MREMIINEVKYVLKSHGFKYLTFNGCFDIFAKKRKEKYIIKVLFNIDAFSINYARSISTISNYMKAFPCIVGKCTRYEWLRDSIIYHRFGIPAMNTNTFILMLKKKLPIIKRNKRGLFVMVSAEKLRRARRRKKLSQSQLAKLSGISKKCIYEHEKKDKFMFYETARILEDLLEMEITKEPEFEFNVDVSKPKEKMQRMVFEHFAYMGFNTSYVEKAPFNIIASKHRMILTYSGKERVEEHAYALKRISMIENMYPLVISEEECDAGVPALRLSEFMKMNARNFWRFLNKL